MNDSQWLKELETGIPYTPKINKKLCKKTIGANRVIKDGLVNTKKKTVLGVIVMK